ncbi:G2 and S phase-expressed protein 1 [Nerophis ophidion]|uniref:G2 and S phase-expressed protein 1 n=1 Tax=Nerophis ophidion TaxID=159077 RepID=UPI002ADFC571|nr:G2 and S phase-expressed protein 1 [Nerophis ophidion]
MCCRVRTFECVTDKKNKFCLQLSKEKRRNCSEMERGANSDIFSLLDEKFDFDVSLSPESFKGEDADDVFLEPCVNGVMCAPVKPVHRLEVIAADVRTSWSPLSGDQLDAVCLEAQRLADRLQKSSGPPDGERFVQDFAAKLGALSHPPDMCTPVKRHTFLMQDSPMKDLPPAIQHRLQRGSGATRSSHLASSSSRLRSSSPAGAANTKVALRGKAVLGAVLPSKPSAPKTSCAAERSRLHASSKVSAPRKVSPSPGLASRARSCEDLLSDWASVASDVSDSSLNSSMVGKRALAPPTKVVKKQQAPPPPSRRLTERRMTSSSSSSVSSVNSSMSLSPGKGKPNPSLGRSLSASTANVGRPASRSTRRSGLAVPADPPSCARSRLTLSGQTGATSKAVRSTPLKRAEATPLQSPSSRRTSAKATPVPPVAATPARLTKLPALATPTQSRGASVAGVSQVLKPKRLVSLAGVDSLPQKAPPGPFTPPRAPRPSGLPTPLKRRMSAIPTATPTNQARAARRSPPRSPAPADPIRAGPVFSLEEAEPTSVPPPAEPSPHQSESPETPSQSEPGKDLIDLGNHKLIPEVLLLDLPAPSPRPHEKLLIDLRNTPDFIRTSSKGGAPAQLIDLTSPLIKWSPEDKKENNAPLINLSF